MILAAVLAFLLNPQLNPLLNEAGKAEAAERLSSVFGQASSQAGSGVFSAGRLIALLSVIAALWLISLASTLVLT